MAALAPGCCRLAPPSAYLRRQAQPSDPTYESLNPTSDRLDDGSDGGADGGLLPPKSAFRMLAQAHPSFRVYETLACIHLAFLKSDVDGPRCGYGVRQRQWRWVAAARVRLAHAQAWPAFQCFTLLLPAVLCARHLNFYFQVSRSANESGRVCSLLRNIVSDALPAPV